MTTLLLNQNDIPSLTSFDGNIDADKIKPYIYLAQKQNLKQSLGADLYKKIYDDYVAGSLTGVYEVIYNEYVVEALVFFSCSLYMNFGGTKVGNNGAYRVEFTGGSSLSEKETAKQVALYNQMGENIINDFYIYMSDVDTPTVAEYKTETNDLQENKIFPWF